MAFDSSLLMNCKGTWWFMTLKKPKSWHALTSWCFDSGFERSMIGMDVGWLVCLYGLRKKCSIGGLDMATIGEGWRSDWEWFLNWRMKKCYVDVFEARKGIWMMVIAWLFVGVDWKRKKKVNNVDYPGLYVLSGLILVCYINSVFFNIWFIQRS